MLSSSGKTNGDRSSEEKIQFWGLAEIWGNGMAGRIKIWPCEKYWLFGGAILTYLNLWGISNVKFQVIFYPQKWSLMQKLLTIGYSRGRQKFLTPKIFFLCREGGGGKKNPRI